MLLGTILVVDVALLGIGMRRQPVWRVAGELQPYTRTGLAVMLVTGPILLTGEAITLYCDLAFWAKLGFVTLAIAFYFTAHRKATSDNSTLSPKQAKSIAAISLALWFCAGLAAKSINYFRP